VQAAMRYLPMVIGVVVTELKGTFKIKVLRVHQPWQGRDKRVGKSQTNSLMNSGLYAICRFAAQSASPLPGLRVSCAFARRVVLCQNCSMECSTVPEKPKIAAPMPMIDRSPSP